MTARSRKLRRQQKRLGRVVHAEEEFTDQEDMTATIAAQRCPDCTADVRVEWVDATTAHVILSHDSSCPTYRAALGQGGRNLKL